MLGLWNSKTPPFSLTANEENWRKQEAHFYVEGKEATEGLVGGRGHWLPRTPGVQPEKMVEKATALSWWKITSETLKLPDISVQGFGKNQSRCEEAFIDRLDCYKTILTLVSNTNLLFFTLWRLESLRCHCLQGVWMLRYFSSALWMISSPVPWHGR